MKRLVAMAAAIAFSTCANAADYRVADRLGQPGCSVAPLENGRWAIVYTGEIAQPKEEIVQFALRCAAEFSGGRNQEWFAVTDSQSRKVNVAAAADLTVRAGQFMGDRTPSGGRQSGQQVPLHVLERWDTRSVFQTILTIQPGSGDRASFPGVRTTPQIFPAASNGH